MPWKMLSGRVTDRPSERGGGAARASWRDAGRGAQWVSVISVGNNRREQGAQRVNPLDKRTKFQKVQ
ncbi:unnamed protein product [Caretta caretta]